MWPFNTSCRRHRPWTEKMYMLQIITSIWITSILNLMYCTEMDIKKIVLDCLCGRLQVNTCKLCIKLYQMCIRIEISNNQWVYLPENMKTKMAASPPRNEITIPMLGTNTARAREVLNQPRVVDTRRKRSWETMTSGVSCLMWIHTLSRAAL